MQLGRAINSNKKLSKEKLIEIGKNHSLNLWKHQWPKPMDEEHRERLDHIKTLYVYQLVDEISLKTEYLQTGLRYRGKLLELFNIEKT